MATITYLGESFDCATALKGSDYIHLLNENGEMIATFDGISDFKDFSITDGDWTSPTADHNCFVAVVKDDGMMGKGNHKCSDILPTSGGTITGNITSNTSAKGFNCTVGAYDVRLMANSNGNRGLYDNNTGNWLLCKDSSNKVTLNGHAGGLTTGAIQVRHCGSMSVTLDGNGYSSDRSFTPTAVSGYTFIAPTSFFSTSSWFSVYGFYLDNGGVHFYVRNHKSSEVTGTVNVYGLYIKTS